MVRDRKEDELSKLPERLLEIYQQSNPKLDFNETQNQLQALDWVSQMMNKIQENGRRAKNNGR